MNTMILPKAIYRSDPIPIKISISFITEIEKKTPNSMKSQKTAKDRQKEQKHYRAIVVKTVWYRQKNRCGGCSYAERHESQVCCLAQKELQMGGAPL